MTAQKEGYGILNKSVLFESCLLNWTSKDFFVFLCGPLRGEDGGGKTLTPKIRLAGPKHFVDAPLVTIS